MKTDNGKSRAVFLTGVTGTLGKEIVKAFLTESEDKLFLLIRRKNRYSHWDRARKILSVNGLEAYLGTRVHVMEGDVTSPRLGLEKEDFEILLREVEEFYHIAALTALNGNRTDCYSVNLGGTEEALKVARELQEFGRLKRFFYFSTAFVAGSRQTYCAKEDELPQAPAHANYYEESKYAAERRAREFLREGLPVTIFRPSIVVGNSQTGQVSEFNVIYPFIRLFAHGILTKLPSRLENSFNIVPIDFVVKASLAVARQKESVGKTFHLVTECPPSIGMLMRLKREEYPHLPPIEIIDPELFAKDNLEPSEQMIFEMLQPYLGYLNDSLTFDITNMRHALMGTDISFPNTDYEFLKTLCRYAVDAGYFVMQ
jgi:long-chain acyl-CoA synthetase